MKRNKIILGLLAVIASLAGNNALAATSTGSMQVNTSVTATCQLTVAPIAFGTFTETPGLIATTAAPNPLKITCTKGTSYVVALSTGSGGWVANRSMVGAKTGNTSKLRYNVYKDVARTVVMGDEQSGLMIGTGTGSEVTTNFYASIPGGQYATPDNYTDNLTVTVSY